MLAFLEPQETLELCQCEIFHIKSVNKKTHCKEDYSREITAQLTERKPLISD